MPRHQTEVVQRVQVFVENIAICCTQVVTIAATKVVADICQAGRVFAQEEATTSPPETVRQYFHHARVCARLWDVC